MLGGVRRCHQNFSHRWGSIFKKWYFHLGHGDLTEKLPIIEQNLNMWEKSHVVLKASTFDSQDLQKFHNLPNTSSTILLKCFSVLAIAFAARGCEIYHLDWNNIKKSALEGEINYFISFNNSTKLSEQMITGNANSHFDIF